MFEIEYKLGIRTRLVLLLILIMPVIIIYFDWDVLSAYDRIRAICGTFTLYWISASILLVKARKGRLGDFGYMYPVGGVILIFVTALLCIY